MREGISTAKIAVVQHGALCVDESQVILLQDVQKSLLGPLRVSFYVPCHLLPPMEALVSYINIRLEQRFGRVL